MLHEYDSVVESLIGRSGDVIPLALRGQRQVAPHTVTALCSYKQLNVSYKNHYGILSYFHIPPKVDYY